MITPCFSQKTKIHYQIYSVKYIQIKEALNYGLVFRGPGFCYQPVWQLENEKRVINYQARLAYSFLEAKEIRGVL
ncbi:MAG: hypothetical protein Q8M15_16260 [Bacteroidota bacterium]|nr:hypothetical protein [Bacteroidota bacterium]